MSDFPWAYIDQDSALSASGPTGSIQFKTHDVGGNTSLTGSDKLIFHTASNLLALTGTMEVFGTASANQININVVDKTITNFSASGDTKFGAETSNTHRFTGSVNIGGALSASGELFAAGVGVGTPDERAAFRVAGNVDATGSIKNKSFVSSSGEVYGTSLRSSGNMAASGSLSGSSLNLFAANIATSGRIFATGSLSSSSEVFGASLRTSGDADITGTMTSGLIRTGDLSSSARVFGAGLETSGDLGLSGSIRNGGFVSSSGETYGTALRTSDDVDASGTIKNSSFISSSGEVFSAGGLRNSGTGDGNFAFSGTLNNKSFISSSGEVFTGGGLRATGSLGVNGLGLHISGSTDFKHSKAATDYTSISGTFEVTGAAESLITLHTQDTDTLKEIAFKKAGSIQSSFGIDSDEHVIIENESTKDIIFRANNQNTIRIFGNQQAVEINGSGVTANATLDVNGNTTITGSLTVSGTVSFGNTLSTDIIFVSGTLTASKGITLQDNALMPTGKKILLTGSALNASASIQHIGSNGHFQISGSGVNGTTILGSKILLDHANAVLFPSTAEKGVVLSGAVGGPGSYLGISNTGQIILTSAVPQLPGSDTNVLFNKDGVMSASADLAFDYDDAELSQVGTFEVKSGSSPASAPVVFQVDGEDGITLGRTKLKLVEAWTANSTHRQTTSRSNQNRFKYMRNTLFPTTAQEQTFDRKTSTLMPNAGRLTKILYRFDHDASGGGSPTFNAATEFRIEMHVAPVTENGTAANSTTKTIHQATASFAGPNVVGGIDLLRDERVTGSWDFGTGSLVGIIMKTSNTNTALGTGFQTYLFEFDHFVEYVSGSGN